MSVTPECYPGTSVFINSLGIRDRKVLAAAEADFTALATSTYRLQPWNGGFDLDHLRRIHLHLFEQIYPWAGELRAYDMAKDICIFTPASQLQRHSRKVFGDLAAERHLAGLDLAQFVPRVAHYYDLINRLHPFPEGNGRTQRLFIEHLAVAAGYDIDWTKLPPWQVNEVARQSFQGNLEPTRYMFEEIISPIPHQGVIAWPRTIRPG